MTAIDGKGIAILLEASKQKKQNVLPKISNEDTNKNNTPVNVIIILAINFVNFIFITDNRFIYSTVHQYKNLKKTQKELL